MSRPGGSTGWSGPDVRSLEKMTLFWHGHFAVANSKVANPLAMHTHLPLLRQHGLGSFRDLLQSVSQDPAHADLAGRQHQPQGRAERELRPRAAGAVHARDRQLHRGRRPGVGARVHRLEPARSDRRRSSSTGTSTTTARRRSSGQTGPLDGGDILDTRGRHTGHGRADLPASCSPSSPTPTPSQPCSGR